MKTYNKRVFCSFNLEIGHRPKMWLSHLSPYSKVSEERILMFEKGKVIYAPIFHLFVITLSWRRDPKKIRGVLWICLGNFLVTCVRRHLQVGAALTFTSRSTVVLRSTVAQSVTSHLFREAIWRSTSSFTVGSRSIVVHSVISRLAGMII